jgi:hypothetical protein
MKIDSIKISIDDIASDIKAIIPKGCRFDGFSSSDIPKTRRFKSKAFISTLTFGDQFMDELVRRLI